MSRDCTAADTGRLIVAAPATVEVQPLSVRQFMLCVVEDFEPMTKPIVKKRKAEKSPSSAKGLNIARA
jgi:hypothetical protein